MSGETTTTLEGAPESIVTGDLTPTNTGKSSGQLDLTQDIDTTGEPKTENSSIASLLAMAYSQDRDTATPSNDENDEKPITRDDWLKAAVVGATVDQEMLDTALTELSEGSMKGLTAVINEITSSQVTTAVNAVLDLLPQIAEQIKVDVLSNVSTKMSSADAWSQFTTLANIAPDQSAEAKKALGPLFKAAMNNKGATVASAYEQLKPVLAMVLNNTNTSDNEDTLKSPSGLAGFLKG